MGWAEADWYKIVTRNELIWSKLAASLFRWSAPVNSWWWTQVSRSLVSPMRETMSSWYSWLPIVNQSAPYEPVRQDHKTKHHQHLTLLLSSTSGSVQQTVRTMTSLSEIHELLKTAVGKFWDWELCVWELEAKIIWIFKPFITDPVCFWNVYRNVR